MKHLIIQAHQIDTVVFLLYGICIILKWSTNWKKKHYEIQS